MTRKAKSPPEQAPVRSPVTVAAFFKAGAAPLGLDWEFDTRDTDRRVISELALNRPGLALAGFLKYYANKRIQVLGLAELAYLSHLRHDLRLQRIKALGSVPAYVVSRGRHCPPDLLRVFSSLGVPVIRSRLVTGDFMNAATVLLQQLAVPKTRHLGTMVDINGLGVLLEGPPGVGKSEIALSLVKRGHSLVSDDCVELTLDASGRVCGSPIRTLREHMEIRGLGIINVSRLFGVAAMRESMTLDLVIHMSRGSLTNTDIDRTGLDTAYQDILGVKIPLITLPVAPGRDVTNVIEVAALNWRLKQMGINPAQELNERLKAELSKKDTPQ